MGQQCGQTWLQTFSEINSLYSSGRQLSALQLVTWNDYEEGTEIESGISNCLSVSVSTAGNSFRWTVKGQREYGRSLRGIRQHRRQEPDVTW